MKKFSLVVAVLVARQAAWRCHGKALKVIIIANSPKKKPQRHKRRSTLQHPSMKVLQKNSKSKMRVMNQPSRLKKQIMMIF